MLSHQDRIGRIGGVVYALKVLVECHTGRATMDENEAADAEDDKIAHTSTRALARAATVPRLPYKAITRAQHDATTPLVLCPGPTPKTHLEESQMSQTSWAGQTTPGATRGILEVI